MIDIYFFYFENAYPKQKTGFEPEKRQQKNQSVIRADFIYFLITQNP